MKYLNKYFILPVFILVTAVIYITMPAMSRDKTHVGSGYCMRCHEVQYQRWQNKAKRQSCESCHGPGRTHVLAPTDRNIHKKKIKHFRHGPRLPEKRTLPEKVMVELFVMSYCPFGIQALNTLLPLVKEWGDNITFKLFYIARKRGRPDPPDAGEGLVSGEKCEAVGEMMEGTDKFVSLHGLDEVLEDIRQVIIAEKYPKKHVNYLVYRNKNIKESWKKAARQGGITKKEIREIESLMDTDFSDSLFKENIKESQTRHVRGSPTLFINGLEYTGNISPYPVERHFCQDTKKAGPCRDFPECGFDFDCKKPGMSGTCIHPMTQNAKCIFKKAVTFTVIVLNDETCETCHTGNVIAEIKKRFRGAGLQFVNIHSAQGESLIKKYKIDIYPAFLFDKAVNASEKFIPIKHTFRQVGDKYLIRDYVIKSYRFLKRKTIPNRLDVFGAFQHPPVIEMQRDFETVLDDTAFNIKLYIHPFVQHKGKQDHTGPWHAAYKSPYGPSEIKASIRQLCVLKLYPGKRGYEYQICRGFDVQKRFEQKIPEPEDEWMSCAGQLQLDVQKIKSCFNGKQGRRLFKKSLSLLEAVNIQEPGPIFLLNNKFRITGYNRMIKQVIIQELGKQL
jgi:hypothetical protein